MMNNIAGLVIAISTLLSFLGIWYLVMWLGRDYHVAGFRQNMFELRAELFDFAADGKISFDHPAYGMLRSTMNGLLQFGHRISLFNMIIVVSVMGGPPPDEKTFSMRWRKCTQELDGSIMAKFNDYRRRMNFLLVRQLLIGSPILFLLILPYGLAALGLAICRDQILKFLRRPIEFFDSAALVASEA
jgi:hypothetical protein